MLGSDNNHSLGFKRYFASMATERKDCSGKLQNSHGEFPPPTK